MNSNLVDKYEINLFHCGKFYYAKRWPSIENWEWEGMSP